MKLMIVDDHAGVRSLIRQLVAARDDVVCECASGEEAVRSAPNFQPDCVTMDVQMPGLSGLEATRAITAALPHTRIVIVTLFEQADLQQAAREAGAAGYVLKEHLASLRTALLPSGGTRAATEPQS